MIITDIPQETPPQFAAVKAKCDKCKITILAELADIHPRKPPEKKFSGWIWVCNCPRCSDIIVYFEELAELC